MVTRRTLDTGDSHSVDSENVLECGAGGGGRGCGESRQMRDRKTGRCHMIAITEMTVYPAGVKKECLHLSPGASQSTLRHFGVCPV